MLIASWLDMATNTENSTMFEKERITDVIINLENRSMRTTFTSKNLIFHVLYNLVSFSLLYKFL